MSTENTQKPKEWSDMTALSVEEYTTLVSAKMMGAKLSTVLNMEQNDLEIAYALAHSQYSSKNFKDAELIFRFLTKMDDMDSRFSLGLAGCLQEQEQYEAAIEYYKLAMIGSGLQDPRPLYQCALCYIKIEKMKEALALLEAIPKVGKSDKDKVIHKQAQDLLDLLTKK